MPPSTRGRSPARSKTPPARASSKEPKAAAKPKKRLPVFLYAPNLVGYVRVATLIAGAMEPNPASSTAIWCLTVSLLLDYFDGPLARRLDQCSQFGDLLDHYCDHLTMMYLVYVTSHQSSLFGKINILANGLHNGAACLYMLFKGHYMKHGKGNKVTKIMEANNYFNMPSLAWNFNTCLIPLIKLSYMHDHNLKIDNASTSLIDVADMLGMAATLTYTIAMWI